MAYAGRRQLGGEVDDGLDGDLRAGVTAPALDLVEQGEALAFLEATRGTEDRLFADGGGVEVRVEDDLPGNR